MPEFSHLHVHTQYSLLDGAAPIKSLLKKAAADNMKAVAMTDHGNLFGAFKFVHETAEINKEKGLNIKPIVGCEFYLVADRHQKSFSKENKDQRFHQLFLAKDQEGYQNLSKLCSLGFVEGMYSKWPRIDKELVLKYHKGLIATSCCIGASVPQAILFKGEEEAEKEFQWWLDVFGDDYYIEIQRHGLDDIDGTGMSQEDVNQVLLRWSKKYNVKTIATNDSHYVNEEDFTAHDILLCINTGDLKSTPIGNGKGYRFGFPNNQFYFKTQAEMNQLFADVPEAIDNTNHIVDKITAPKLKSQILLPNFQLPPEFKSQDDYLEFLAFEGAKRRYKILTPEIEDRIRFELKVIRDMGFPGYFLIVQDFIAEGRKLGVWVGPGRGSAAGSVVAFCIGITNIDPIKYNLLFERFLNPERVSMPDIDIDFDDEGRGKVINYVIDKYGKNQVAQIITYGTMAAKMAIRDVSRVLDLPLPEADRLAKLVPDISLYKLFNEDLNKLAEKVNSEGIERINELRKIAQGDDLQAETLRQAARLEGSVRNTGIHAAGVIIAPKDLMECIPVCTAKDADLWVTQFDGKHIEDAGMLKMDFLGLKNLTIIRDALGMIKENKGIEIDIDEIPLDDKKTFELFQRGETVGIFQFESDGMSKYLQDLKPTDIEDLIAMNALYRPGPLQFIPNYIQRKHGHEKVEYPHELLEPILKHTYGIMVYQEQIMQAAQIVAGYSLGGADLLRRAMGKKKADEMAKERVKFVAGAKEINNIDADKANEIFDVMEKFASYGFNRSHSAAYAVVAYQTAYLKANHTAEYMASVLTHNMGDIDSVAFFVEECRRQKVTVLGPDVNESAYKFSVNDEGQIRIGLGALKGVGENAVNAIILERKENGPYVSVFDVARRVNLRTVNKRCFESLAYAGGFDCFPELHRSQYFFQEHADAGTFVEKIVKYGSNYQDNLNSSQHSLFGDVAEVQVPEPSVPQAEPWPSLVQLKFEKDVIGIYISGHPLDTYSLELKQFCNQSISAFRDLGPLKNREVSFGGMVTNVNHRVSKNGKPFGTFTLEDYTGNTDLTMFGEDYLKFRHLMVIGNFLFVKAKIQERWMQKDNLELKVLTMQLLSDVREKMIKNITIDVPLEEISSGFMQNILEILKTNPGNCNVRFNVIEKKENLKVELNSRKFKVAPHNEFLKELETRQLRFRLN